jgi:hypothetical protein
MIHDFEDFCLYSFVIVDDIWQTIAVRFSRPGSLSQGSDNELITTGLANQYRSWDTDTESLDH